MITWTNWPPSGVGQFPASSAINWCVLVSVTPPRSIRRSAMSSAIMLGAQALVDHGLPVEQLDSDYSDDVADVFRRARKERV